MTIARSIVYDLKEVLLAGARQPLWFRTVDTVLTMSAAFCFVLATAERGTGNEFILRGIEDIINIFFTIGFALDFWANGFLLSWFVSAPAVLELLSILPVLSIPLRGSDSEAAAYVQLLQVFKFVRLLRETRLVSKADRADLPPGAEVVVLGLTYVGLIAVSGTVLYIYENDSNANVNGILDGLLFMSNIFTARPAPFKPATDLGKIITIVAFITALVGIPFFVAEISAIVMDRMDNSRDSPLEKKQAVPDFMPLEQWTDYILRIDLLVELGLLVNADANRLRMMCYDESEVIAMVMVAYRASPPSLLATRLLECLEQSTFGGRAIPAVSSSG